MGVLLEGVLSYHVLLVWLESVDGGWFMASCRSRLVFAKGQAFMELLSFLMVKMH